MSTKAEIYCLDANVLIQAYQKYYSPKFCPDYWEILDELGKQGKIFLPEIVNEEITRTEDDLSKWLKKSSIQIRKIDEPVTKCLQDIYSKNSLHKNLVDNTKARSLADPWVIAHAMREKATVVTKEEKVTALNSAKIKIPNVCDNMGVRWINDFQFVRELNIQFSCIIK
jgi:predicted nucleic acid-binding protein